MSRTYETEPNEAAGNRTWWEPERVGRMSEERGKAAASGCLSGRLVGANNRQAFGYSLLPTRA